MSGEVEDIARAICEAEDVDPDAELYDVETGAIFNPSWWHYKRHAEAVIARRAKFAGSDTGAVAVRAIAKNTLYRCETCPDEHNCHPADEMFVYDDYLICDECRDGGGIDRTGLQTVSSALLPADGMREALEAVAAERRRQVEGEGWALKDDDIYRDGELAAAAGCYIFEDAWRWPFSPRWWKPTDRRRNLVKAGALILAEIERLDRAALAGGQP